MSVTTVSHKLLLLLLQIAGLYTLSRVLFKHVLQAAATGGGRGGWLINLLRLPGNAVHELSHAIGYVVCGYRVKQLILCTQDPAGRGRCVPGKPWSPVAMPWLATTTSAVAPLIFGALALRLGAYALDIPVSLAGVTHNEGTLLFLVDSVRELLLRVDYRRLTTILFLYIAFSIGAELAPSGADIRRAFVPLTVTSAVIVLTAIWLGMRHSGSPVWPPYARALVTASNWLSPLLIFGIVTTSAVLTVTFIPTAILCAFRYILDL